MELIRQTISKVRVGTPTTFGNLTVFPLLGANGTPADYLTLDEALQQKSASITEVSEGGSVPQLKFVNSGDRPVFLLDGEELVGAKQNRVLNLSILVPAFKTIIIPVSCVEAGRWHHRSHEFSAAPRAQYAGGRAKKMAQVTASMKSGGRQSDQRAVWDDILLKLGSLGASSPTAAMSDIYEEPKIRVRLEDYVRSFPTVDGQLGALFAIDSRIVGFDLFDSPDTLRKLYGKLLRSYGLDALEQAYSAPPDGGVPDAPVRADAEGFLSRVSEEEAMETPALGEGHDLRIEGDGLNAAALEARGRIVHFSAFR